MALLKRFIKDQRGLETVEWVIMGALVVLGIVAAGGSLLPSLRNGYNTITNEVELAGQSATP